MHLTENFVPKVKESKSDLISLLSVSENHSFLQKPQENEIQLATDGNQVKKKLMLLRSLSQRYSVSVS